MPQMSPNLWLLIMTFTTMIYIVMMFKLYFINIKWKMKNKSKLNNKYLNKNILFMIKW